MEIKINQDIRSYKAKDIGNFSLREAGFIALGLALAGITYYFTKILELAIIPMALVLVVGFIKPFGMTFIQFLRTVGRDAVRPKVYPNRTDFVYDIDELEKEFGKEYRIPDCTEVIQTGVQPKYIPKKTEMNRVLNCSSGKK